MNDTPRTDALLPSMTILTTQESRRLLEHARTLERELAEKTRALSDVIRERDEAKAAYEKIAVEYEKAEITHGEVHHDMQEAILQRDLLGQAIAEAAIAAGIIKGDAGLTGPHLIMLAGNLAEAAQTSYAVSFAELEASIRRRGEALLQDDDPEPDLDLRAIGEHYIGIADEMRDALAKNPLRGEATGSQPVGSSGTSPDLSPPDALQMRTSGIEDALLEDLDRMREKIHVMREAMRRSLDWLASYPGGGALNCWKQVREALAYIPSEPADKALKQGDSESGANRSLATTADVIAEYDRITAHADPHDSEWDFVMRASDYRILRAALGMGGPTPLTIDVDKDCQRYRWMKAHMGIQPMFPLPGEARAQVEVKLPAYDRRDGRLEWALPGAEQLDAAIDSAMAESLPTRTEP